MSARTRPYLQTSDRWPNMFLDLSEVPVASGPLYVDHFKPPVQELVHCSLGPGATPFVDLVQEAREGYLCLVHGLSVSGSCLYSLAKPQLFACELVDSGVDLDSS